MWWNLFRKWLGLVPRPWEVHAGTMFRSGHREIGMNRFEEKFTFSAVPANMVDEITHRRVLVTVDDVEVLSADLPVAQQDFTFQANAGQVVTAQFRYVDNAGNASENPLVISYKVEDDVAPPDFSASGVSHTHRELTDVLPDPESTPTPEAPAGGDAGTGDAGESTQG